MHTGTIKLIRSAYNRKIPTGDYLADFTQYLFFIKTTENDIKPLEYVRMSGAWALGTQAGQHYIGKAFEIKADPLEPGAEQTPELKEYEKAILELIEKGGAGTISKAEFKSQWIELTTVLLGLMALAGSQRSTLTEEQEEQINEQIRQDISQVDRLADEVYRGDFVGEGDTPPKKDARKRIGLWVGTATGTFFANVLFREDDPFLEWVLGKADHCKTCLALAGVVLLKSQWANLPFKPRVANGALACGGWKCQCGLYEVEGPARGVGRIPRSGKNTYQKGVTIMVPHNYYGVEEETAKRYTRKLAAHIRAVQDACKGLGVSDDQARRHDLSKWGADEFPAYAIAKFDGSPQGEEFQRAWLHHIHYNPHHWQHWVLYAH